MRITLSDLEHWALCRQSITLFKELFGRSVKITPKAVRTWRDAIVHVLLVKEVPTWLNHPGFVIDRALRRGLVEFEHGFDELFSLEQAFVDRVNETLPANTLPLCSAATDYVGMNYSDKRCCEAIIQVLRALGRKG